MKEIVLPPMIDEPRVLEDQVHTWPVEGWRTMNKKVRGPVFQAGGYPWLVEMHPVWPWTSVTINPNHVQENSSFPDW